MARPKKVDAQEATSVTSNILDEKENASDLNSSASTEPGKVKVKLNFRTRLYEGVDDFLEKSEEILNNNQNGNLKMSALRVLVTRYQGKVYDVGQVIMVDKKLAKVWCNEKYRLTYSVPGELKPLPKDSNPAAGFHSPTPEYLVARAELVQ